MTDDLERPAPPQPSSVIAEGFGALVDGLRTDIRDVERRQTHELSRMEGRVTAQVADVAARVETLRRDTNESTKVHYGEHEKESIERRREHDVFRKFMRDREIREAVDAGILGAIRFAIEQTSRHAPRLVALILSVVAAVLTVSGSLHITVGGG